MEDNLWRQQLRQRSIAAREALTPLEHARLSDAVVQHLHPLLGKLNPSVLGFCWPYRNEVDLRPCVTDWLTEHPNTVAALPIVIEPGRPLCFRSWHHNAPLDLDRYGIPYPSTGIEVTPEVLLIPLNAFDRAGYRIGYGGGYFDRTLAKLTPAPITVGIGFELGRVESTRPQPFDQKLDWMVTEAGHFPCGLTEK